MLTCAVVCAASDRDRSTGLSGPVSSTATAGSDLRQGTSQRKSLNTKQSSQRSLGVTSQQSDAASQALEEEVDLRGYLPVAADHASAAYTAAKKRGEAYTFTWLDNEYETCCFAFPGTWTPADWEIDASFKSILWEVVRALRNCWCSPCWLCACLYKHIISYAPLPTGLDNFSFITGLR